MSKKAIRAFDGRAVGTYHSDTNVYVRKVRRSRHLFNTLNAWGIDYAILHYELPHNATVRIFEKDERIIYEAPVGVWRSEGVVQHHKGHGLQSFLPLARFKKIT